MFFSPLFLFHTIIIQKSAFFFPELGTAAVISPTAAQARRQFEEYGANIPPEFTCLYWDDHKMPLRSACCKTKMLLCLGVTETLLQRSGWLVLGANTSPSGVSPSLGLAYQYIESSHMFTFLNREPFISPWSQWEIHLLTSEEQHLSYILKLVLLYIETCYQTSFWVMSVFREGLESQVV